MIDPYLETYLRWQGYLSLREMPDGTICGIAPFLFTFGLVTKLSRDGLEDRWCYKDGNAASIALSLYTGQGDPLGPWIKYKGIRRERHNPKLFRIVASNGDGSEVAFAIPDNEIDHAGLWTPNADNIQPAFQRDCTHDNRPHSDLAEVLQGKER